MAWIIDDRACTSLGPNTSVASLRCLTTEIGVPLTGVFGDSNNARSLFLGVTIKGIFVDSCWFILFGELGSLGEGVLVSHRVLSSTLFWDLELPNTGLGGDVKMLSW